MMGALVDALSAMTGAAAEEEDEADDAGITPALRSGATNLARAIGGSSLARIAPREMQPCLLCPHRQEGMKITTRTRG